MGGKCKSCRSYNTTRVEGELIEAPEEPNQEEGQDAAAAEVVNNGEQDGDWETDEEKEDDDGDEQMADQAA